MMCFFEMWLTSDCLFVFGNFVVWCVCVICLAFICLFGRHIFLGNLRVYGLDYSGLSGPILKLYINYNCPPTSDYIYNISVPTLNKLWSRFVWFDKRYSVCSKNIKNKFGWNDTSSSASMDRTMYGKVDPGARQPFRCAVRERGLLPGCKWRFIGWFRKCSKFILL